MGKFGLKWRKGRNIRVGGIRGENRLLKRE